ncbi:MAG: hypothetical protein GX811_12485 [Lentisphaerae bacterium]|nr:hypothetical protein [Lentisphaerota bacterium]
MIKNDTYNIITQSYSHAISYTISHAMTYSHGMTKAAADLNAPPDTAAPDQVGTDARLYRVVKRTGRFAGVCLNAVKSPDVDRFMGGKDLSTCVALANVKMMNNVVSENGTGSDNVKAIENINNTTNKEKIWLLIRLPRKAAVSDESPGDAAITISQSRGITRGPSEVINRRLPRPLKMRGEIPHLREGGAFKNMEGCL